MRRSNCLFFALAMYWRRGMAERSAARPRRVTVDGERYLVVWRDGHRHILSRVSRLGSWLPHLLYAELRGERLRIVHFVPYGARAKAVPPPLFLGFTKWGD